MNDPGSLQNLNDIVAPAPVPWWPPAPGWYVLAVLLLLVAVAWGVRRYRNWLQDRYRREALQLLGAMRESGRFEELPAVLKRCAVAAWPREEVASLSGTPWHEFLDRSAAMDGFCSVSGETLDQLSFSGSGGLPTGQMAVLADHAEYWLRHHLAGGDD